MTNNQQSTASRKVADIEEIRFGEKLNTEYVNNKYPNEIAFAVEIQWQTKSERRILRQREKKNITTLFNIETSSQVQIILSSGDE